MNAPSESQAVSRISALLAEHLGLKPKLIRGKEREHHADFVYSAGDWTFVVEYKRTASAGGVAAAAKLLQQARAKNPKPVIPVVAVPFMGDLGREVCRKASVCWMDLSGNANLVGPGLRIVVTGRPNRFAGRGRPTNLFAPRSSRITRCLLLRPDEFQTQTEIARTARLDDGYVSKLVRSLKEEQLVIENDRGAIRARDPNLLLDAWSDAYQFEKHRIMKGHVSARSGEALLDSLARKLERRRVAYAATGLGAAWLWTKFAGFRIVTIYLREDPSDSLLGELDFLGDEQGANTWLVTPNDDGVFDGSTKLDDIDCVSALQAYLDLQAHPERAKEAAAAIRERLLNWRAHAKET